MSNFDPKKPYNQLPILPPTVNFKDQDILIASLEASEAIAALNTLTDSEVAVIITSHMFSPFFIPEAVASSQVEDVATTNELVLKALAVTDKKEISGAEKEAMNYQKALVQGMDFILKKGFLATNQYVELQQTLVSSRAGIRKLPGTTISNPHTKEIYYTPPEGEEKIRTLLKNFEEYFNEESPTHEVYARMAILHYQFEAIHPFYDGNGRTGRMLMPLYLLKQRRLTLPVIFLSKYILEHRDEYNQRLRAVTKENDWKKWILFMTKATAVQAEYTTHALREVNHVIASTRKKLREEIPQVYSAELVEYIFTNPFFSIAEFQKNMSLSYVTARKYLQTLEQNNILRKTLHKNRFLYFSPQLFKILRES
ncbi:MAG: Fic family protein [Patescibacteria group bacterium]|nr:Fic family protein [Patescibacteria group bacterium]